MLFLLLFVVLPFVELNLLLRAGAALGWPGTLLLVVGTGVLGASLARSQGGAAWARLQAELAAGRQPGPALVEAFAILLAGIVLLTPGFLTDALGLAILLPLTRRPLLGFLGRRLVEGGRFQMHVGGAGPRPGPGGGAGPRPGPGAAPFGGPDIKDADVIDDGRDQPAG